MSYSPKNITKKSSSNSHSEVPAIHQIPQREKQEDTKFNLKNEQLIDSSHSPRGSYLRRYQQPNQIKQHQKEIHSSH